MDLSQDTHEWFGRSPEYGMGRRPCKHLGPDLQVIFQPRFETPPPPLPSPLQVNTSTSDW